MKNLILIGFMASGKSTIGKLLSKELHWQYLDTDKMIEKKVQLPIREIFARDGENAFREWEALIAKSLLELENKVIATGGGLPIKQGALLKKAGKILYLKTDAETVFARTENDYAERPLINISDPQQRLAKIKEILAPREKIYRNIADYVVENNTSEPYNTVMAIKKILRLK
jgi:shikimate kinase